MSFDRNRLSMKKGLGFYYTDRRVVEFFVDWGMGVAPGSVMDPSCGDGRFLEAAIHKGASPVVGCDLDKDALELAARPLEWRELSHIELGCRPTVENCPFLTVPRGS
jgi:predicted RNA methylase